MAACVSMLMTPLKVVLKANATLNAASVVVGSPIRARNACTSECESWCSSVVKMSGTKNHTAVRMLKGPEA